jgi:alpha-galactosidase
VEGPYPHGIKPVTDRIRERGLTTGLWFLPFARNHQDPEYRDRQDWFVRRQDGTFYETPWCGTSLDLTYSPLRSHLVQLAKTIRSWGVRYFKIDGLWTGMAAEQIHGNDGLGVARFVSPLGAFIPGCRKCRDCPGREPCCDTLAG